MDQVERHLDLKATICLSRL